MDAPASSPCIPAHIHTLCYDASKQLRRGRDASSQSATADQPRPMQLTLPRAAGRADLPRPTTKVDERRVACMHACMRPRYAPTELHAAAQHTHSAGARGAERAGRGRALVPSTMVDTVPPRARASRTSVCRWNLMPSKWLRKASRSAACCSCTSVGSSA